ISNATYALQLAAAACGLGAQWVTLLEDSDERMKPILGVPPIIRIHNMVPIGFPAFEVKTPFRRELEEIVHYERYDMSKYRSHQDVQDFILKLRELSKPNYPLK
ncbi:MAG: hypothetical protein HYY30_06335, partial [Chloroflexi bacterium]|nr:hypothetical protein [Chloroflexota bacterium]